MRSAFPALAALILLPAAASLTACGDAFGGLEALVRTDSVVLASATGPSARPTALDIASNVTLRQPELPAQAGLWDIQVRQEGVAFFLVPSPSNGTTRGAGLQKTTRDFANPGNAPRKVEDYTRTAVQVAPGETYFVQTRPFCGSTSSNYAILKILATLPDSGVVQMRVTSNQNCDDERLEP